MQYSLFNTNNPLIIETELSLTEKTLAGHQ